MTESAWWRWWKPGQEEPLDDATLSSARAQPGFHDALRHSLAGGLRLCDGDAELHRFLVDNGVVVLCGVVLYLDATGGLTHRRLRDLSGIKGILSGGRISALLMRIQMIGYIRAVSPHTPGAVKLYRPTQKMMAAMKTRFRLELEAVTLMAPELEHLLDRYDGPDGLGAMAVTLGEATIAAAKRPLPQMKDIVEIGFRRAGNLLMCALVMAAADAQGRSRSRSRSRPSPNASACRAPTSSRSCARRRRAASSPATARKARAWCSRRWWRRWGTIMRRATSASRAAPSTP